MSAVLRASAPTFDVDAFLLDCDWKVARVFRRGEEGRKGVLRDSSGFNVVVSESDFDDFAGQTLDAIRFLNSHRVKIRELVSLVGNDGAVLDFVVRYGDAMTQSNVFSSALVRAAGACGLALEISRYPISDDAD